MNKTANEKNSVHTPLLYCSKTLEHPHDKAWARKTPPPHTHTHCLTHAHTHTHTHTPKPKIRCNVC